MSDDLPTYLVVDANNFVFALRHVKFKKTTTKRTKERFVVETLLLSAINNLLNYAKEFKVDGLVLCVDSPKVWRRDFYAEYKANHTAQIDDPYFEDTIKACDLFMEFFRDYTAAVVLKVPHCEADDIIGVWCQESDGKNIILSSDKDFIQLINDKTTLYSPVQKCWRETDDPVYDLFVKCIRGDRGDNVHSAYPRVQETKLRAAWNNGGVDMMNLLETILPDGSKVGDRLDMNIQMIDLAAIPANVRERIIKTITSYQPGKYSELKALKFLADNGLKNQRDVLQFKEHPLRKTPVFKFSK